MPWQTKTATPHQTPNELSPAIVVSHVTMQFKRAKDEATSLKELLVRTLRRQHRYEIFLALDDISFTIQPGEVVGIIGTAEYRSIEKRFNF